MTGAAQAPPGATSDATSNGTPDAAQDTAQDTAAADEARDAPARRPAPVLPKEIGGAKGPEPTRYGDWQHKGRCTDF